MHAEARENKFEIILKLAPPRSFNIQNKIKRKNKTK